MFSMCWIEYSLYRLHPQPLHCICHLRLTKFKTWTPALLFHFSPILDSRTFKTWSKNLVWNETLVWVKMWSTYALYWTVRSEYVYMCVCTSECSSIIYYLLFIFSIYLLLFIILCSVTLVVVYTVVFIVFSSAVPVISL